MSNRNMVTQHVVKDGVRVKTIFHAKPYASMDFPAWWKSRNQTKRIKKADPVPTVSDITKAVDDSIT